ncbi:hypothetical protein PGT21_003622 [Puccinia graminis f. sp. tritici]|uniref:Uncharacterized protein n=1 Tax=Puccinia graminis f. sp. tritici TaxID=56615 RepID=A0A5B0NCV1_PUCGR|nr:hypothetical protein PGT21_003622 [Puccinia graminis f. sp. tritici]
MYQVGSISLARCRAPYGPRKREHWVNRKASWHPLLPSFHSSRVIGSVLKCGRWDSHIPILVIGVARSLITDLQTPWDPIGIPSSLPSKSSHLLIFIRSHHHRPSIPAEEKIPSFLL